MMSTEARPLKTQCSVEGFQRGIFGEDTRKAAIHVGSQLVFFEDTPLGVMFKGNPCLLLGSPYFQTRI